MIMPKYLQEEEKRLAEEYFEGSSEIGILQYAELHGSEELKAFYKAFDEEQEAACKAGIIIN